LYLAQEGTTVNFILEAEAEEEVECRAPLGGKCSQNKCRDRGKCLSAVSAA
jgi:hypothetical protein